MFWLLYFHGRKAYIYQYIVSLSTINYIYQYIALLSTINYIYQYIAQEQEQKQEQ